MNEDLDIPYLEGRHQLNRDFPFKIFRYSSPLLKQSLHMHDYVQIAYVRKGMCNHQMLGRSLTVSQGDLFIIAPGTGHSIRAIEDQAFELILADFSPELLEGHLGPMEDALKRYLTPGPASAPHSWLHVGKHRQPLVLQLLQDMQDEYELKEVGYEFAIRVTLVKLLMVADREYRAVQRKPSRQPVAAEREPIEEARRYVHDNYSQDIPLEHGAYIANMAPAYFSHMFKHVTGQSFIDYVNEVRIERAKALIRRQSLTVTQIGFQVGYRHLSHFIRTFKKRTGITPTEYKKTFGASAGPKEERGMNV
ncbi:AraC family transcriptional regulator [Cohnella sp. JJ-181]|uniref:AraC family transcriptional regulator n=1 Tax=Cohnella rhizoplanae TaxID=2974897 RepID=UPI0022FF7EEC|nr:AraC family transcriptional regulator [Cohnella sp. JJ-181]CAI6080201.1 HTH-type transcriptional activator RhaR [Cohnella sp. JJ-181]